MSDGESYVPVILGMAVGAALLIAFSMVFTSRQPLTDPTKRLSPIDIIIPEGASLVSSNSTFRPQIARMVVGTDFIRWSNHDTVPARIEADNDSDPDFYKATRDFVTILPGQSFEFTFTRPGEYYYHGAPWQRGSIRVLASD